MTKDRLNSGNPAKGTVQTNCTRSFSSQFTARAMASRMSCRCALRLNLLKLDANGLSHVPLNWRLLHASRLFLIFFVTFVCLLAYWNKIAPSRGVGFCLHLKNVAGMIPNPNDCS